MNKELQRKILENALEELNLSIQQNYNDEGAYFRRGEIKYELGLYDQAIDDYQMAANRGNQEAKEVVKHYGINKKVLESGILKYDEQWSKRLPELDQGMYNSKAEILHILGLRDTEGKFHVEEEEIDPYESDYWSYYNYESVSIDKLTEENRKVIEEALSSTVDLSPNTFPATKDKTTIAPNVIEKIKTIEEQLRALQLYEKPLTTEEIQAIGVYNTDTDDIVYKILEYRHLCGVFDFDNGYYAYNLPAVFQWIKKTFGERIFDFNYYTHTHRMYFDRDDGTDLEEIRNVLHYTIVLQHLKPPKEKEFVVAAMAAHSSYYPENFWDYLMNKMGFEGQNTIEDTKCRFFYDENENTTDGHILYLTPSKKKELDRLRAQLKEQLI